VLRWQPTTPCFVPEPDLFDLFIAPLERAGLDSYMISGSIASIQYGEPRATLDVDIAMLIGRRGVTAFPHIFSDPEYYCPPIDVLEIEVARPNRGHFNIIHSGSGLKADFYPSTNHPYFSWAMKNRKRWVIREQPVWFSPPEYVILWKLEFFREGGGEKHLRDVRGMVDVSGPTLDFEFLKLAVKKLDLDATWTLSLSPPGK